MLLARSFLVGMIKLNIVIKKVENDNDEVLTFLACEYTKMFLKISPNISEQYQDNRIIFDFFSNEFKRAQKSKQATIYAVYYNDEIIGAGQLDHDNYLSNLFVKAEYRNKKVGTRLLEQLINSCVNLDVISVDVKLEAVSLFRKFSFKKVSSISKDGFVSMELERGHYGK